ncbi:uncharacterized protein N7515_002763 [Penicillium bovifimosum]|uniref:Uncharacterized protein n=1 Tax=Penicillium bovifimosum TaxID=126998 RepID=A0A9W9HE09_9EURO|nr:uncharacterized protein N7515_002763 [Penicillium bovifimosum]KAJ5143976.1 hypothetical protein N7515_002763 [Penicillium bovifimosum]
MAQELDLGHSVLRIRDSNLQLCLAASAHLSHPMSNGTPAIHADLHVSTLDDIWITEGPELKLCFFVWGAWDRDVLVSFVSMLSAKIRDMKIWSELGFSADATTDEDAENIGTFGFHWLEISLRKDRPDHRSITRRTLPDSMINPPDVCPPPDVPVVTLSSIDVQLEYRLCEGGTTQNQGLYLSDLNTLGRRSDICEQHFQLLETGIRRLVISSSFKDPTIHVSKQAPTKSLTNLFPVVFNPGYRDAMNQRGTTIPTLTRSMSSMLLGSNNPSIKARFANLLQLDHSPHTDESTARPEAPLVRSAVHASFWRAALKNVSRPRHYKRKGSTVSASASSSRVADQENDVPPLSMDQHFGNETLELLDNLEDQAYPRHVESDEILLNSEPDSEDQLFDNVSDIGFTDTGSGESTQTSLDTLLSTQASSEDFDGDHEAMMLSSPGELADYEEDSVADYDACEDMQSYDTDMIMADDF